MKKTAKAAKRQSGYDFRGAQRGPVIANPGKTRITIYVDNDVLDAFRQGAERDGQGYQTAINRALRDASVRDKLPVEERVRLVVREEIAKMKKRA